MRTAVGGHPMHGPRESSKGNTVARLHRWLTLGLESGVVRLVEFHPHRLAGGAAGSDPAERRSPSPLAGHTGFEQVTVGLNHVARQMELQEGAVV